MKLKAIIVDDELNSRTILKKYLKKYCPDIAILGEAENIIRAGELIEQYEFDILFLDVEMPYGNAFDLLSKIENRGFEIVFVAAYDHYAIEAVNQQACYYLLKPIAIDDLILGVNTVKQIKETEMQLHNKVLIPKNNFIKNKITIPQLDGFNIIENETISYCKADDNYTEINTDNGKIVASKTLKYFENALKDSGFVRIHKSYLVNVSRVMQYKKGKGGSVVLDLGIELPISPSKKSELLCYFK